LQQARRTRDPALLEYDVRFVDAGTGTPIVLVPGIQGRWEWMKPAVDALAGQSRVITFSLSDEPTAGVRFDETRGFWCYVDQIAAIMDATGVRRAAICGVSYGGLIAAAFAARFPDRVSHLALVSAIPPAWSPDARVRFYLRAPLLLSPVFAVASVRLYREIAAAAPTQADALAMAARHGWRVLTHMLSPSRMARRVHLLTGLDLEEELRGINVPTLVLTGEAALDRVVPVHRTREYLRLWPHAHEAAIPRTGHLGLITRPEEFARLVVSFVERAEGERTSRRHVG
jgi:pimeloyl-ACP methyl ester carboxylesterase